MLSWQVLSHPTGTQPAVVLAGMVPHNLIFQYETLMSSLGLKIGLVDLSSFNLFNAYRQMIGANGRGAGDFAVLNATVAYFTLMFFHDDELVFFRCKVYAEGEGAGPEDRAKTFRRELATSLSYYAEKLKGAGLARTFTRIADPSLGDSRETLDALGFGEIEPIDPSRIARLPEGMDGATASYLAPAMGAAAGRS